LIIFHFSIKTSFGRDYPYAGIKNTKYARFGFLKRPSQKSLPSSLQREESFCGNRRGRFHFFPLWKRGRKGDFTAFKKTKLFPYYFIEPCTFIASIFIPGKTRITPHAQVFLCRMR
jgi:hypothetical protein